MDTSAMEEVTAQTVRRAGEEEVGCSDAKRFELELEFVQLLASPQYMNWLAQSRLFEDAAFLNYLQYLQYWLQPQYAKFVIYPHALQFLRLLQTPEFRTAIASPHYKELVHSQQFFAWLHAARLSAGQSPAVGQQPQGQAAHGGGGLPSSHAQNAAGGAGNT